jgi:proline iminopeptidase
MEADHVAISLARLECHYMLHSAFLRENQLLTDLPRMTHLPATIVQGRYDIVCPIVSADDLQRRWAGAEYVVVPDGGHSAWEPGVCAELVAACERFKMLLKPEL